MTKKVLKNIFKSVVIIFALWGFALTLVFFAMKFGLTKTKGLVDDQSGYFKKLYSESQKTGDSERIVVANKSWESIQGLPEWQTVKAGISKDERLINLVSEKTGVSSRLLIAPLVTEQLRLMTSERSTFKKYFQPLSVLGTQTQFSLGIYGIKENTAKQIESNLKDKNSEYYLGSYYEHMLDYDTSTTTILVDKNTLEPVKNSTSSNPESTTTIRSTSSAR
jgi:hypothetical protein